MRGGQDLTEDEWEALIARWNNITYLAAADDSDDSDAVGEGEGEGEGEEEGEPPAGAAGQ